MSVQVSVILLLIFQEGGGFWPPEALKFSISPMFFQEGGGDWPPGALEISVPFK